MSEGFVIWTRYTRPDGKIVRHVYGVYPTRARAKTVLARMVRDAELRPDVDMGEVEAVVTKLVVDREA